MKKEQKNIYKYVDFEWRAAVFHGTVYRCCQPGQQGSSVILTDYYSAAVIKTCETCDGCWILTGERAPPLFLLFNTTGGK